MGDPEVEQLLNPNTDSSMVRSELMTEHFLRNGSEGRHGSQVAIFPGASGCKRPLRLYWKGLLPRSRMFVPLVAVGLMVAACDGEEEPRADPHVQPAEQFPVEENAEHLSPPIVVEPLYACSPAVTVQGFVPEAEITVLVDGNPVATATSYSPWGQRIELPAQLVEGEVVTATQTFDGVTSAPSAGIMVRSHTEDYPHGFAAPSIRPTPLYACGGAVGVGDLVRGSLLQVSSETLLPDGTFDAPTEVGRVNGAGEGQWLFVSPDFSEGNRVTARFSLCSDTSPSSLPEIVQPEPSTIPAPTVDEEVYENGRHVVVRDVVNGAVIDVFADGSRVGGHAAPGGAQTVRIDPPAVAGQVLTAEQKLCSSSPTSAGVPVRPCSELPPAKIRTPSAGDDRIEVIETVPGARVIIFADGEEVGDGGGPLIQLSRPIRVGEEIVVVQRLGDCESSWVYVVDVECLVPEVLADPSGLGIHAVGRLDYELPAVTIDLDDSARLWATVRYPATSDGLDADLSPGPARFPLVIVLHGNHGIFRQGNQDVCSAPAGTPETPNHEGYNYVLESLARGGFIAVSINANDLNCLRDRIAERGQLILEHLARWKQFDDSGQPDPVFGGKFHDRVDLSRIGLMGHSRGGEAVVSAARANSDPDLGIRSVLSLAPTDGHRFVHSDIPLLMVLPAADGDVFTNSGAKIYDRAPRGSDDSWFKSQMYIYGAIHNYFNQEWLENDWDVVDASCGTAFPHPLCGLPHPPNQLGRGSHETMLRAWTRTFFELTLKGSATYVPAFSGDGRLSGIPADRAFPSYHPSGALTVDDHEQSPDNPNRNTLADTVTETGGVSTFDEFQFTQTGTDRFNDSFFHETDGLIIQWEPENPRFESEIPPGFGDVTRFRFLSFRVTQPVDRTNDPAEVMNFMVGLEDRLGARHDVEITSVGVIPFPYEHPGGDKSMMRTLRVPLACFAPAGEQAVAIDQLHSVHMTFDRVPNGTLGLDDLEFTR